MKNSPHIGSKRKENPQTLFTIVSLIWITVHLYLKERAVLIGIPDVFLNNILETIWNILFFIITVKAFIRVIFLPAWFLIFADNQKLGQKLQWYNNTFSELIPQYRNLNRIRWGIVLFLALFFKTWEYIPFHFFQKWALTFSELITITPKAAITVAYFNSSIFIFWRFFGTLCALIWFLSMIEGRGRIIARILLKWNNYKEANQWKAPLSSSNWNHLSHSFNLTLFTYFTDWQNQPQLKPTAYEKWYNLEEKGLKTNTLVVAPTGGGKTSGIVIPLLEQALQWQANNPQKKATIAIYDPKAEPPLNSCSKLRK